MSLSAYLALTSAVVLSCTWGAVAWSRRAARRLDGLWMCKRPGGEMDAFDHTSSGTREGLRR